MRSSAKKWSLILVTAVLASFLACGGVGYAAGDGLVANYRFDGDFNDSSGNKNNGTVIGSVALADDSTVGKCAVFSGGYIEVPSKPNLNMGSKYTISVWIMVDPVAGKGKVLPLVSKLDDKAQYNTFHAYARGTFAARLDVRTLKNGSFLVTGGGFDNYGMGDRWTHLAFVFDGQRLYMYVDGAIKGMRELKGTDAVVSSNGKLRIGTGNDMNAHNLFFMGKMADVRLYNRALGAGEVQAIAGAGANAQ